MPLEHYSLSSHPKHIRDIDSSNTVGEDSLEHGNLPRWIRRLALTGIR